MTVLTVGHSTRSGTELFELLQAHAVTVVVDVRRFPVSRRHPQFSGPALAQALAAHDIAYIHEPDLGGHRDPRPDSANLGWRVTAFRGYADHMETPEFQAALGRVIALAGRGRPVVMCAEADPLKCHRQLVGDALVARGVDVAHILGAQSAAPHVLTPTAVVAPDLHVRYPAPQRAQRPLFRAEG